MGSRSGTLATVLGVLLAATTVAVAIAEPQVEFVNAAVINESALHAVSGIVGINQAAGDINIQANLRAIGLGADAGNANVAAQQVFVGHGRVLIGDSHSSIDDDAFNHAKGLVSINQSSGIGNIELNTIEINPATSLSDDALATTHAVSERSLESLVIGGGKRSLKVQDSAFIGSRGVVQVNQSAGVQNVTRNHLEMHLGPSIRR
ncbi:MAG: hypothetical protein ACFCUG_12495 [Thiotrichales bacterium]